jgi:hypothetical protein
LILTEDPADGSISDLRGKKKEMPERSVTCQGDQDTMLLFLKIFSPTILCDQNICVGEECQTVLIKNFRTVV